MSVDVSGVITAPHSKPTQLGTCCTPPCDDPARCDRERRASETEWIRVARRPVNWGWKQDLGGEAR